MAGDPSAGHRVRLENLDFEGPLDLLVYLVQQNEIDIWDIPIALVTEQFLGYVDAMTPERLEHAGEFLLMAATLLRIKSRMLLPRPDEDEEEIEDPRRELVLKIIEYQQFREIADHLRDHEADRRLVFARGYREAIEAPDADRPPEPDPERRASLSDLLRAFAELSRREAADRIHRLEPIAVTIEEKAAFVRERLRRDERVTFSELFLPEEPRTHWIVTFVALLEMAREREIRLRQSESFGEIHVYAHRLRDDG
ncbi:MAG: segregation/condensation protein A [Gemmatimonadota bacterium]|nr:segregation/condensation protein A [Gemmatimonadota bacterium]